MVEYYYDKRGRLIRKNNYESNFTVIYVYIADGVMYIGKVLYKYRGTMPVDTEIIVKDGTTLIVSYAVSGYNNLKSITLPDTIVKIRNYAFNGCAGLTTITIPESVVRIGTYEFGGGGITTAIFDDMLTWGTTTNENNYNTLSGGTLIDVTRPMTNVTNQKNTYKGSYWCKLDSFPQSLRPSFRAGRAYWSFENGEIL